MTTLNKPIDYFRASRAITLAVQAGYNYVEAPWIVSHEADLTTRPEGVQSMHIHLTREGRIGSLVASAEQGMIQLMLDDHLKPGRYVSAGPCFRPDKVDELHQRTFFKVELTELLAPSTSDYEIEKSLHNMIDFAVEHFTKQGLRGHRVVKTEAGYDIECNNIEIGSYGFRNNGLHSWLYGTGLALPRFDIALQSTRQKKIEDFTNLLD